MSAWKLQPANWQDYGTGSHMRSIRGNRLFKSVDRVVGIPILAAASLGRSLGKRSGRKNAGGIEPGSRILVIKQSALGDTLLLLPVLKALKERAGRQGKVDILVTQVNIEVATACPWLDQVHLFEPSSIFRSPVSLLRLLGRIRKTRYDIAMDFDQWLRSSALLSAFSGAPLTAGFRTPGQHKHFFFDLLTDQSGRSHETELFARIAASAGLDRCAIEKYPGFLSRHGLFEAETGRGGTDDGPPVVLFHPGCGSHGWQREWPAGNYIELGRSLKDRFDATIEISGWGGHEEKLSGEIAAGLDGMARNLAGTLSFPALARHLLGVDLLVSGNTGIMHLAAGLGRPLIALHGPTDSRKWGPFYGSAAMEGYERLAVSISSERDCAPCLHLGFEYGCDGRKCMESITVRSVLDAAVSIIEELKQ